MKKSIILVRCLVVAAVFFSFRLIDAAEQRNLGGLPICDQLPLSMGEATLRAGEDPTLSGFVRNGELIDTGVQAFLLGENPPLGPAPHTPWARPLPGRPIRLIVISELQMNHDIAEIQRRLDCQASHIMIPHGYYWHTAHPEAIKGYFTSKALETLRRETDVIVVGPVARELPSEIAAAITAKVEAGCGLVLLGGARYGGGGQYGFWPTTEAWKKISLVKSLTTNYTFLQDHKVQSMEGLFDGVPFELMPGINLVGLTPVEGARLVAMDGDKPLAVAGNIGAGRVLMLPWASWFGAFPVAEDNRSPKVREYQEYYASAMIRAILWSANHESPLRLKVLSNKLEAGKPGKVELEVTGDNTLQTQLTWRIRDLLCRNRVERSARLVTGSNRLDIPPLAAGQYLLDCIARDGKGVSLGREVTP